MKNIIFKRMKIIGCVIVMFIIMCTSSIKVSASSLMTYQKIDGVYSAVNLNGVNRLFYLKLFNIDGRYVYCIELGKNITSYYYDYNYDLTSLGYSSETMEYVNLISHFGYGYLDHYDYHYYMAAQEMIWEYLFGVSVDWVSEEDYYGERIDIDSYKNEIFDLISMSFVEPTYMDWGYTQKLSKELVFVDNADVLSNYYIFDDNGIGAYIDGNKLIIPNEDLDTGEFQIRLRRISYNDLPRLLFYSDNSQTMYAPGYISSNDIFFNFEIKGGGLILHKYDSINLSNEPIKDCLLSDAKYELYNEDNELVYTFVTDEDGLDSVDNLMYGKYTIKEVEASYGYNLDDTVYEVTIDKDVTDVYVYEEAILKKIEIYKTYDGNNAEVDVVFQIFDEDMELYDEIITDSLGYGEIFLPYGNYTIKQYNSLDGYSLVDDINVVIDENSDDVFTYYLDDVKIDYLEDVEIINPKTYDGISFNINCLLIVGGLFFSFIGLFVISSLIVSRED